MMRVKVCGITCQEDALLAAQLGAHALGFIFAKSPRQVQVETVRRMVHHLPPFLVKIGVFVNERPGEVLSVARSCLLDGVQLHGQESTAMCSFLQQEGLQVIKALPLKDLDSLLPIPAYLEEGISALLFDSYHPQLAGGTGEVCPWDLARKGRDLAKGRIILAGGLGVHNILEGMKMVAPLAVDVNSGIEIRPGKKDPEKMKLLLELVGSWRKDDAV